MATVSAEPTWLPYFQLFRLPNVFTAWADILAGFLAVTQFSTDTASLTPWPVFLCLITASSLIYSAGMALNDYYDLEQDRRERPQRPLPSGRVSPRLAAWLGYQFLLVGVVLAAIAGYLYSDVALPWRGGAVAVALVASVLLYDAALKSTVFGAVAMGACRFFNLLLGMSLAGQLPDAGFSLIGYDMGQLAFAGGIGVYIAGVTWFARTEAKESSRPMLIFGFVVLVIGLGLFVASPLLGSSVVKLRSMQMVGWCGLMTLIAISILRRCIIAIADPSPGNVQVAVKQALLSLITLNAGFVLGVCGAFWAVIVALLIAPMLLLGRWVYST
ncbi:UbiA family prenyltransferase [Blastopirellula sp. JC732]|uniref:UbiA family prenyltransferase n=1 Tax=Blastopirellula sediminis TaxID=2894196 RepID=A0A9X1MS74_9BACT|nr:UbiA family prenyltransferase [Blastopirellula sediminis]MCC9605200.1 UbiA family prenyltransferase [Blastopirellula sediminis]MCC9631500.1 UbiA family prenyltransferase [Blastopirellula sediminis]